MSLFSVDPDKCKRDGHCVDECPAKITPSLCGKHPKSHGDEKAEGQNLLAMIIKK